MRGKNYRQPKGQPYARADYIHGAPPPKISKFVMGDTKGRFEYCVLLKVKSDVQIRHNALEAARIAVNKSLFKDLGESGYRIKVRVYPHVVLRENKMIATAGADRLQEGMRRAFGKPIGRAARVKADEPIIEVYVDESGVQYAKNALKTASSKIPVPCKIEIEKIEAIKN
jgi:large subunit ribosomal protein L10e